ncbi:MAG: hypothetical protein IT454_04495 [Planctomycetes bacterium]|nr:hypothetical protein [Planctomycetota bacterium]
MLVSTELAFQARTCVSVFVPLFIAAPALPSSGGPTREDPKLEVVELAPRPVQEPAAPTAAAGDERADAEPASELGEALQAQLPFKLSVLGMASYQSLDGDTNAGRLGDYLVGYLDVVVEAELWEGTTGVVEWESVGGNGPDEDAPSFGGGAGLLGWNANAGSAQDPDGFDRFYLAEAFVSMGGCCDGWVLDLGKIASSSYIDTVRVANDSVGQFMTGAFCNASTFQAPFRGGGVAASYVGNERFDVRALAMRPDNSGHDAASGVFGAAQVGVYWSQDTRPGSCALYGWSDGSDDDQLGVGLNLDQDLGTRVTAFGRLAFQDEDDAPNTADLHRSWSLGFELREGFTARESDLFAIANGENTSDDSTLESESLFEAYYKRAFNAHCEGSLHIQSVDNAGGADVNDRITGLGLRLVFMY